jgi:hypothetical protein
MNVPCFLLIFFALLCSEPSLPTLAYFQAQPLRIFDLTISTSSLLRSSRSSTKSSFYYLATLPLYLANTLFISIVLSLRPSHSDPKQSQRQPQVPTSTTVTMPIKWTADVDQIVSLTSIHITSLTQTSHSPLPSSLPLKANTHTLTAPAQDLGNLQ